MRRVDLKIMATASTAASPLSSSSSSSPRRRRNSSNSSNDPSKTPIKKRKANNRRGDDSLDPFDDDDTINAPPPPPSKKPSKEDRRSQAWILLVDDEESIRTAVGQLLSDSGFGKVTVSIDGQEALQQLLECQNEENADDNAVSPTQTPDCIVTDVRMPIMDGLELLCAIRNLKGNNNDVLSQIPVVVLTAKGMTNDRIAGYDAGADAYLSKPFAPEELVAIIDQVLERYQEDTSSSSLSVASDGGGGRGGGPAGTQLKADVQVADLQRELEEIKDLLLRKGGAGVGNGWVEQTNVFLTKDERQVLELLSDGLMTKEIAAETHLSTRRIEQLLTRMFRKAGVKNRTELVRWAVSTGNVDAT